MLPHDARSYFSGMVCERLHAKRTLDNSYQVGHV